ncbi:MAG TPA: pyridoxal-phosphate dependent enzyme, partial [Anaerolineales bacterium]|nr:pyridoxal-phosphate dependent enzyme [Anaerolineales bacterium]
MVTTVDYTQTPDTKIIPPFISINTNSALAGAVGNTPLLPLQRLAGHLWPQVQVYAKAEWFNPGGSVKDRPALNILLDAVKTGKLNGENRLLDSTSGNMGIAYATLATSMGIPVTLTIPENASPERIKILKALGAELILTDPLEGSDGAMLVAQQMAKEEPDLYYYANQYD